METIIKSKRNIKDLYEWQKEFFDRFNNLEDSVIINAPTGAGKTIIAEAYILKALALGKKAIYIAPLRSLASEKYNEWKKVYGWDISAEFGDFKKVNKSAEVYIYTFEKFLLKVVNGKDVFDDIDVVIIDEIHALIEGDRGSLLEFSISLVKDKKIVGLSATVKNLQEVAKWLNCEVFSSVNKIVNVEVNIIHNSIIYDKCLKPVGFGDWIDVVVESIIKGKKVIVFTNKRSDTKRLVSLISERVSAFDMDDNLQSDDISDIFGLPAHKKIAYHNGAMDSNTRKLVEDSFKSGRINCIVATKTLAMGVNLPADVVVIKDLFYFEHGQMKPMKVLDVWQMIGRAGRYTKHGEAYIVAGKSQNMLRMTINRYIYPEYEEIKSKLVWSIYFKLLILYSIQYLGNEVIKDDIYEVFNNTFFRYFFVEGDKILQEYIDMRIEDLVLEGFINERKIGNESIYSLSSYGKLICKFCVSPEIIGDFLFNIDKFENDVDIHSFIAWMVAKGIFGYISCKKYEYDDYSGILSNISSIFGLVEIENLIDSESCKILKTIDKLWKWVEGKDIDDMILIDLDSGLRYISLFKILAKNNNMNKLYEKMDNLYYMIKYGVGIELVEYVRQKGVGRKKALRYLKV